MKNTKCPLRKRCWDYGDCEDCDIGLHTLGVCKQINRLKIKNAKLTKELVNARAEAAKEIFTKFRTEIRSKITLNEKMQTDSEADLYEYDYYGGRIEAYLTAINYLDEITKGYTEDKK